MYHRTTEPEGKTPRPPSTKTSTGVPKRNEWREPETPASREIANTGEEDTPRRLGGLLSKAAPKTARPRPPKLGEKKRNALLRGRWKTRAQGTKGGRGGYCES